MANRKGSKKSASDSDSVLNEYLDRKAKLRKLHQRLKDTKDNQEIYHRIMGSTHDEEATEVSRR